MSTEFTTPSTDLGVILDRLRALESQLVELSRSPSLRSASITGGALVVKDDQGTPKLRVGLMSVGGYGIEALDQTTGRWWPISSIASAQQAASSATPVPFSVAANAASGWSATGPAVTVTTYTGRLTVQVGAALDLYGNKATLAASYQIVSAAGVTTVTPAQGRGVAVTYDTVGQGVNLQAGYPYVHTVAPGTYTITVACQQWSGAGEASTGTVANRTIVVRPD